MKPVAGSGHAWISIHVVDFLFHDEADGVSKLLSVKLEEAERVAK